MARYALAAALFGISHEEARRARQLGLLVRALASYADWESKWVDFTEWENADRDRLAAFVTVDYAVARTATALDRLVQACAAEDAHLRRAAVGLALGYSEADVTACMLHVRALDAPEFTAEELDRLEALQRDGHQLILCSDGSVWEPVRKGEETFEA